MHYLCAHLESEICVCRNENRVECFAGFDAFFRVVAEPYREVLVA